MFYTNGPTKAFRLFTKKHVEGKPPLFGVNDEEETQVKGDICKSVNDKGSSAAFRDFIVDLLIRLVGFSWFTFIFLHVG